MHRSLFCVFSAAAVEESRFFRGVFEICISDPIETAYFPDVAVSDFADGSIRGFASLTVFFWLALLIIRFKNSGNRKKTAVRFFSILCILFAALSMSFTLMLGIQYTKIPLETSLELDASQKSAEDLKEVSLWLADNIQRTRALLPEDDKGVWY
jgi:hypothetical protein